MASPYDIVPGKIFIGGISPVTTQETIQNYFGQFGELCDCVLMQDKATGKSRGFGFVTYKDSKVIDKVLNTQNIIDGKEVDCKRAVPRDQQGESTKEDIIGKTRKLFVGGLPQTTTEEQFRAYFEQFGKIEDSVIMADKETGKSRGFGFVTFDSEEAVERVIQRYYDNKIEGKWVECKRAQPKDMGPAGGGAGGKKVGGKFGKDFIGREGKGQGFYQDTPSSHRSGRSQTTQDPYGDESYSGGYMSNMMRDQGGYGPNANYPQNFPGYPPGYGNGFDPTYGYNTAYPVDYGNPYSGPYNNSYGGGVYSGQYPGGYMGQGYPSDPMASGGNYSRSGAHSGSNYGQAGGYDPSGYGYGNMQGGYGGPGANGGALGSDMQNRGNMSGMSKNSPSGSQDGQQGVGPVKGSGGKKQGHESRYYTPY